MRESDWYKIDVCTNCESRMSYWVMYNSGGVCPKCGYNSYSCACDSRDVVLKEIKHHKWWEFWRRKYTYIGIDKFSQDWIDRKNVQ